MVCKWLMMHHIWHIFNQRGKHESIWPTSMNDDNKTYHQHNEEDNDVYCGLLDHNYHIAWPYGAYYLRQLAVDHYC
jgi:hypothetical protein